MNQAKTRPSSRCIRTTCGAAFADHLEGACPNGSGEAFRKQAVRAGAASQSFNEEEVELLSTVLRGLPSRADMRQLTRAPAFANIARKVATMSRRVKAAPDRGAL